MRKKLQCVVVCHFLFQQKISRRANVVAKICLKSTVHTHSINPGVFCNSAIKAAETDHDTVVQSILQTRKHFQKLVAELFRKIDTRGLGHLTITEFERHFDDHAVRAFFDYLQIGAIDAWTLFVSLAAWRFYAFWALTDGEREFQKTLQTSSNQRAEVVAKASKTIKDSICQYMQRNATSD